MFLVITGCICLYIYSQNLLYPRKQERTADKIQAMNPPVDNRLVSRTPTGVILGRQAGGGKGFVIKPMTEDGHVMCIGGSGSGKSACLIIPTLMANPNTAVFALDIKGELSFKSGNKDAPDVVVINPEDRSSYGWDPFWRLQEDKSDQSILKTMKEIVSVLIPERPDAKEPMWGQNARALLTGLMVGFYKIGKTNFIQIIDEILSRPTKESLNLILETAPETAIETKLLAEYPTTADDTLSGFISEYRQHLNVFLDGDIRYAFGVNPQKADPSMLEGKEEKKIFLSIKEEMLADYYDVLQLIVSQVLNSLVRRKENSKPVMVILDELPRLTSSGKLSGLLDAIHTVRSRKVTLIMVTQSLEALETAYSKSQVMDMVANSGFILVYDVKSPSSADVICKLAGKYKEKDHNWSVTKARGKISTSYKEKDILEISDLMQLIQEEEAVLLTPYGYCKVRKTPYFKDRAFAGKAEKIRKYNETIIGLKGGTKR